MTKCYVVNYRHFVYADGECYAEPPDFKDQYAYSGNDTIKGIFENKKLANKFIHDDAPNNVFLEEEDEQEEKRKSQIHHQIEWHYSIDEYVLNKGEFSE